MRILNRGLLKAIALLGLTGMQGCGSVNEGRPDSTLNSQSTYYYYCIQTGSEKWFNENGRTVQKMFCSGGGLGAHVSAGSFGEAQGMAGRECVRRAGSGFTLGGAGNYGPGAAGGDVSTDNERVDAWFRANCYGAG